MTTSSAGHGARMRDAAVCSVAELPRQSRKRIAHLARRDF
jgi:hypothetical protein